jgi:hypothetical protein
LRFVNRQVGSGTRLLMDHLLHERGLKPRDVAGYESAIEESHVAIAACVASGIADVGLGAEAAALEFGLHFLPIVAEDYFLACLKTQPGAPAVLRLRELPGGRCLGARSRVAPRLFQRACAGRRAQPDDRTALVAIRDAKGRTPAGVAERRASPPLQAMP